MPAFITPSCEISANLSAILVKNAVPLIIKISAIAARSPFSLKRITSIRLAETINERNAPLVPVQHMPAAIIRKATT